MLFASGQEVVWLKYWVNERGKVYLFEYLKSIKKYVFSKRIFQYINSFYLYLFHSNTVQQCQALYRSRWAGGSNMSGVEKCGHDWMCFEERSKFSWLHCIALEECLNFDKVEKWNKNCPYSAFFWKYRFESRFSTPAQFVRALHIEPTWLHGPGHGAGVWKQTLLNCRKPCWAWWDTLLHHVIDLFGGVFEA